MAGCDLCGKGGQLYQAMVEGTTMTVCESCKGHGEVVRRIPTAEEQKRERKQRRAGDQTPAGPARAYGNEEMLLLVRPDYAKRIKAGRERLGLKQEDIAKRLRMKESQYQAHETGTRKPDLETARVLEKALRIDLVEQHVEKHDGNAPARSSGPMTIADLMKK